MRREVAPDPGVDIRRGRPALLCGDGLYMQRPVLDGRSARVLRGPAYAYRVGALACGADPREGPCVTAERRIEEFDAIRIRLTRVPINVAIDSHLNGLRRGR